MRETVRLCRTPLLTPLRNIRSALANFACASPSPAAAAARTARTALRVLESQCLLRARRFNDCRWRFAA